VGTPLSVKFQKADLAWFIWPATLRTNSLPSKSICRLRSHHALKGNWRLHLRRDKDPVPELRMRSGTSYSDKLVEVVEWCMALNPLARPQSVFELQTALANYQASN
jgi:hypothetical protein